MLRMVLVSRPVLASVLSLVLVLVLVLTLSPMLPLVLLPMLAPSLVLAQLSLPVQAPVLAIHWQMATPQQAAQQAVLSNQQQVTVGKAVSWAARQAVQM